MEGTRLTTVRGVEPAWGMQAQQAAAKTRAGGLGA